MFELSQDLGMSLSLSETLSVLSMRLRQMIPYDSIAVFVNRNGWLLPELVSGDNFRVFSSLKIRVGEGLCGWVAENSQADRERQSRKSKPDMWPIPQSTPRCNRRSWCRWKDSTAWSACWPCTTPIATPSRPTILRILLAVGFESGALGGECPEVSAGRELGDHRLSDRPAQCAIVVCPPGARSGALPPHEVPRSR